MNCSLPGHASESSLLVRCLRDFDGDPGIVAAALEAPRTWLESTSKLIMDKEPASPAVAPGRLEDALMC